MTSVNPIYHFDNSHLYTTREAAGEHIFLFQALSHHCLWRYKAQKVTFFGCYFRGICTVEYAELDTIEYSCSLAAESCQYYLMDSQVQKIAFDEASVCLQDFDEKWSCKHGISRPQRREISSALRPFLSGTGDIEDEDIDRLDALLAAHPQSRLLTSLCTLAIGHVDPWANTHFLKVLLPRLGLFSAQERVYFQEYMRYLGNQNWFMPEDLPIVESIMKLE